MWLWSSTGASSLPRERVERPGREHDQHSEAATIAQRIPSAPSSSRAYGCRTRSKPRLTSRVSRPSLPVLVHEARAHHRRQRHRHDPDTTTAAASVIANSRNSEPVSPPWKPIGVYTAAR